MVYEFKSPCYGAAEITLIHDFPWTLADISIDMGSGADDCESNTLCGAGISKYFVCCLHYYRCDSFLSALLVSSFCRRFERTHLDNDLNITHYTARPPYLLHTTTFTISILMHRHCYRPFTNVFLYTPIDFTYYLCRYYSSILNSFKPFAPQTYKMLIISSVTIN